MMSIQALALGVGYPVYANAGISGTTTFELAEDNNQRTIGINIYSISLPKSKTISSIMASILASRRQAGTSDLVPFASNIEATVR